MLKCPFKSLEGLIRRTEDLGRLPEELHVLLKQRTGVFSEMLDCSFKSKVSFCYRGITLVKFTIVSSRVSTEDAGPGLPLVKVPV